MTTFTELAAAKYVLVTTFRRDGTGVPTPVWAARDGDHLVVWTVADSGKVKRIRRDGRVTVAPCTLRGKPLGPAVPGTATILDGPGARRVRGLLKRKYWLTGPLTITLSTWRRGEAGTVGLRISLGDA
ncbi:MAG TPA: PPOX class F420-dependent oxidoreductase [Micromonosporaceae bacterium]|nr:PPOX class F420-dependent oxidoreductase [Micromonosporaceae bacterium]